MPYASITGAPKTPSRDAATCGGRAAEDERTKRRRRREITPAFRDARASTAWCIVGTAVYQVGSSSFIQSKKEGASKPGEQATLPPAESDARSAATSPWMWKSGMTARHRSAEVSASDRATLRADDARFD